MFSQTPIRRCRDIQWHTMNQSADTYTRTVLTVIAACLLWLSVKPFILPSETNAQTTPQPQRVVIAGWEKAENPIDAFQVRVVSPVLDLGLPSAAVAVRQSTPSATSKK